MPELGSTAVVSELRYTIAALALLVVTMLIPGGRVLVLPAIFILVLVLLYWAAKPTTKPKE